MTYTFQSIDDFGFMETTALLNEGFSDYIVPLEFSADGIFNMIHTQSVDRKLSQIVLQDGKGIGVGLIARRGWSSRLAGMAIIPTGRGKGAGQALVEHLIEMSVERGDKFMHLEVIESNLPAASLYAKLGFETVRRLISMKQTGLPQAKAKANLLEEIDSRFVADRLNLWGLPELPWQVAGETVSHIHQPSVAYRLDDAFAVISDPSQDRIALRAFLVDPTQRRRGEGRALIDALLNTHPGKEWVVPAICPAEMERFFKACGFSLEPLAQLQMRRRLY